MPFSGHIGRTVRFASYRQAEAMHTHLQHIIIPRPPPPTPPDDPIPPRPPIMHMGRHHFVQVRSFVTMRPSSSPSTDSIISTSSIHNEAKEEKPIPKAMKGNLIPKTPWARLLAAFHKPDPLAHLPAHKRFDFVPPSEKLLSWQKKYDYHIKRSEEVWKELLDKEREIERLLKEEKGVDALLEKWEKDQEELDEEIAMEGHRREVMGRMAGCNMMACR